MDSREAFELQKLLAEERTRTEQHKLNYQTLKLDHQRLQEECETLRSELSRASEAKELTVEAEQRVLLQTERELAQARAAIDELNHRSMALPSELTKLNRYHEEAEKKLTKRILIAEEEADSYRNQLNRLRCEYGFLRAEYEHERIEFGRQLEEMKLRYESELVKIRENSEALKSSESSKSQQKEIARLTQQVAMVSAELAEAQEQLDRVGADSSTKQRQRVDHIMELTGRLASLELEKSSASHLCDKLQQDLRSSGEELSAVRMRLVDTEAERNKFRLALDDCERTAKMDAANRQVEVAKTKVEFEETIVQMQNRSKDLKVEVERLNMDLEASNRLLREKDTEFARKLTTIQDEHLKKFKTLEVDKNEFEAKYRESEKKLKQAKDSTDVQVAKVEERSQRIFEAKRALETEILILESKLDGHRKMVVESEALKQENELLRARLEKLTSDMRAEVFETEKLVDRNERLKEVLEKAKQKMESHDTKMQRLRSETDRAAKNAGEKWDQQKAQLKKKVAKLDRVTKDLKHDLELRAKSYKRKTSQYTRLITKLRNRLELLNARVEELQIERETLQKWVPHDVHDVVKKRLRDLQLRHDEYKRLLQTHHLFGGEAGMSAVVPLDGVASVWLMAEQEQSLKSVKDRLRQLQSVQTNQLEGLTTLRGTGPFS